MSAIRRLFAEVTAWVVVVVGIITYEAIQEVDLKGRPRRRSDDDTSPAQGELESDIEATNIAEGNTQHNTRRETQ